MTDHKPLIDPKELLPMAVGLAIGVAMMVGFALLAMSLDLTLFVDHGNIPHQ